MQPVTSTFTTTVQQEQSNNWITIHCRSLCMHDCLVTACWSYDRPVRTGDVIKFQVVLSPVRSDAGRSKTGTCERGLRHVFRPRSCSSNCSLCGFSLSMADVTTAWLQTRHRHSLWYLQKCISYKSTYVIVVRNFVYRLKLIEHNFNVTDFLSESFSKPINWWDLII